jgi:cytochrome c oxidase assembly protein Cox11
VNVIVHVFKTPEWVVIQFDSSNNNNVNRSVSSLVIRLAGPVPYVFDKVVPYQYNATMIENGQEVPLPVTYFVVNITDIAKVTRSGRVFGSVSSKEIEDIAASKKEEIPVGTSVCQL